MTESNPYKSDPPILISSFVCHADILGFSQLSSEAISAKKGDVFLNEIRSALSEAYSRVRERAKGFQEGDRRFSIKVFTDNIVVGYPAENHNGSMGEDELGHMLVVFSEFQLALAMEGFLVRGGIAFGDHYMDDDIVFGGALLESVKLDCSGGAPKISLAPSVIEIVRYQIGFYSEPEHSPQSYFLLQDADGSIFVNYLNNAFMAYPDGGIFFDVFDKHRNTITDGLIKHGAIPDVRAKYEWAARYHNFVCMDFKNKHPLLTDPDSDEIYAAAAVEAQRLSEYLIDIESLAPGPGEIKLKPLFLADE